MHGLHPPVDSTPTRAWAVKPYLAAISKQLWADQISALAACVMDGRPGVVVVTADHIHFVQRRNFRTATTLTRLDELRTAVYRHGSAESSIRLHARAGCFDLEHLGTADAVVVHRAIVTALGLRYGVADVPVQDAPAG